VIKFDNRPFKDVEEMEEKIVENWNNVVTKQDTTYILGDFCWSADENEWIRLLDSLNGAKVLVKGNHCLKQYSATLKKKFADIKDYKEITDSGRHVIMCHYPILLYKGSYDPKTYMLCGHVHTTRENDFLNKWKKELRNTRLTESDSCGNIYNVGCMLHDYTPKTLEEIIEDDIKLNKESFI
jgi:calcineurin-like phosphoesterase family protein